MIRRLVMGVALLAFASTASAQIYTSQAAFEAAMGPGNVALSYFENFNGVANGPAASLNFGPVNGFSYTVFSGPISGLFNDSGRISTDNADDPIRVTFTGAPVFALGGNFWATDINFNAISANIDILLSNGQSQSYTATGPGNFRGFISPIPITGFTVTGGLNPNRWPTMDNLRVGVPEPTTMGLLLLGASALLRRR